MAAVALQAGAAKDVTVEARHRWNGSGIAVHRGEVYAFEVPPKQIWYDTKKHPCGPGGYDADSLRSWEKWRRRRDQLWFALIGAVGKDERRTFPVLNGVAEWTAPADGELFFYANDVSVMYWNNSGTMKVTVRRLR